MALQSNVEISFSDEDDSCKHFYYLNFKLFSNSSYVYYLKIGSLIKPTQSDIVQNLRKRFKRKQIYVSWLLFERLFIFLMSFVLIFDSYIFKKTKVAEILIAVNPCEDIAGLYSNQSIEKYIRTNINHLDPHIFSIGSYMIYLIQEPYELIQC